MEYWRGKATPRIASREAEIGVFQASPSLRRTEDGTNTQQKIVNDWQYILTGRHLSGQSRKLSG